MAEKRICSVEGCDKPSRSRGWCVMHYTRWVKHGCVHTRLKVHGDAKHFAEDAVNYKGDDCLIWPYSLMNSGYPDLKIGKRSTTLGGHRFVCIQVHGEPPTPKHHAAHSCGNRKCVNPRHLRWATASENLKDKLAHGTAQLGEQNPISKLTTDDVLKIRSLYPGMSCYKISKIFGITDGHVWLIVNRRQWKHI